ncbi:MAG: hypothetical protein ACUVRG_05935, partial [Ignavibacterium sp.]
NYIEKNLVMFSKEEKENYSITQERKIIDQRVVKKITIKRNGNEQTYFESVKLYDSNFLTLKLKEIGFDIINLFGDFLGNEFDENLSPRFITICQKS